MLQKMLDRQYGRPSGWLGRYIGFLMARQHYPENMWTLAQLRAQPGDRVLEVGCGPGIAIKALSRVVTSGHVSAVDISAVMVSAARRRNMRAVAQGRVDIRHSDVTVLPCERMVSATGGEVTTTPDFIPYSGAEIQTLMAAAGFGDTRIAADFDAMRRSNYSIIGVAVS
jgi:SAM-dependent methyltransferase